MSRGLAAWVWCCDAGFSESSPDSAPRFTSLAGGKIHRPPYELDYNEKKILILHEPNNLDALVASGYFDAIIYGHTHDVDIQRGRTIVINPGECGGWLRGRRTVALWDVEFGEVEIVPV